MKAAAYLRVSTDRQAEEGLGLAVQREAIESWADEYGADIVEWHTDEGKSGGNGMEHRVGLYDVLQAVKSDAADALVVYRLDRLARDLILQETILRDVWAHGVDVFSCDRTENACLVRDGTIEDDDQEGTRRFIRQIFGAMAEYERSTIGRRLRAGRRRKAREGGYAYGAPPYGWKSVDRQLVEVPEQQAVIERIRQLLAQTPAPTFRVIAETLNAEGYPGPRGPNWHHEAVRRVVRRLGAT